MHFADQAELFPQERSPGCLRLEIATCAGPCAGGCTRTGYGGQVRAAKRFLDGTDDKPLKDLTALMTEASAAMQFERAGALRDRLAEMEWLWEKLNWLRQARKENTFVYPLAGPDGRTVWYLIHRGRVRGACYRPTCPTSTTVARELLADVYAADLGPGVTPGQVDHVLLVSGWFRKNPAEKAGLLAPAEAAGFESVAAPPKTAVDSFAARRGHAEECAGHRPSKWLQTERCRRASDSLARMNWASETLALRGYGVPGSSPDSDRTK